jgi:hypothetical protein
MKRATKMMLVRPEFRLKTLVKMYVYLMVYRQWEEG